MIFEVPTGVVADTRGRRFSFMLGAATLLVSTLLYLVMWNLHAPLWGWAIASILLGLGFTFFSGATEAWLVDALAATGFTGNLESVFGRAQVVGGGAMLVGSVAGGFIAQLTDLGVPYIVRAGMLGVTLVVAWWFMHDLGFTPERGASPLAAVRTVISGAVDGGLRNRPVRWLMLAAPFTVGVGFYAFYAFQPYLLELFGDPNAYGIAGLAAAIVAAAQILGGLTVGWVRRLFKRRTDALILGGVLTVVLMALIGLTTSFVVALVLMTVWCLVFAVDDSDAPGVHQRPDPVTAARDRPLVRCADRIVRRRGRSACARPDCRRLRLRHVVRGGRRDPGVGGAVRHPRPPRERSLRPDHLRVDGAGAGRRLAAGAVDFGPSRASLRCDRLRSRSTQRHRRSPTRWQPR